MMPMTRDEILAEAQALMLAPLPFVMATVDQDQLPRVRWMGAQLPGEALSLYLATEVDSRKMSQLQANPHTQLMFHAHDFSKVLTAWGTCEEVDDPAIKQRMWDEIPVLREHASGPDDPTLTALLFTPSRLELLDMAQGEMGAQTVEL
jgi:general stress protein 26